MLISHRLSDAKESACNAGDLGLVPGSGKSPGGRYGNPLQYSCLENPMDRGERWATVLRVAKSPKRLSDFTSTLQRSSHTDSVEAEWVNIGEPLVPSCTQKMTAGMVAQWLTLCSQCRGPGFDPWWRKQILHAAAKDPGCSREGWRSHVLQLRPGVAK